MSKTAVSSQGVGLEVKIGTTWTKFYEVKSVPEIGTTAATIDATCLDDTVRSYIKDIPDWSAGTLDFTMNAMPIGATNSNIGLIRQLSDSQTYEWRVIYPKLKLSVSFSAEFTYRIGGAGVSQVQDVILSLIPSTAPLFTPIETSCTVTYNANGGTGEMTDSNSPYNAGDSVTTMNSTFTAPDGKVWVAWNTKADRTGIMYDQSDVFQIYANTTLYAVWEDEE